MRRSLLRSRRLRILTREFRILFFHHRSCQDIASSGDDVGSLVGAIESEEEVKEELPSTRKGQGARRMSRKDVIAAIPQSPKAS